MTFITRRAHFNAAHRLHNPDKSDEWNKKIFGKCNSENWHGHNYEMEVTVAGKISESTGYVIDIGELKAIMQRRIIEKCDHKNLNLDVDFLDGIIPTTENLVKSFYHEIKDEVENACHDKGVLYSVKLYETKRNYAEYCPYAQQTVNL